MSRWREIWNKRQADNKVLHDIDQNKIFMELKRLDGYDILENGISLESFEEKYEMTKKNLSHGIHSSINLSSVYEVGCGSGANLFLFEKESIACGGADFSESLIHVAKDVLHTDDLTCDEAVDIPREPHYDAVLSDGVFCYFPDERYAEEVLDIMLDKCTFSIGILDLFDTEKQEEYIAYRKKIIENYEERYKDLPRLFYSKSFFEEYAKKHGLDIYFPEYDMPGYWNNQFDFHCFMYKRSH